MLQILFRELQDPNQANENSRGLQQLLQLWIGDLTQSLAVSQSLSGRAVSHQAFVSPPVLANYFSLPSLSAGSGHLPNLGDEAESAWSQLITEDRQPAKIFTSSAARQDRKETLFWVGARRLNKHQPQNKNMHKVDDFSSRLLFEWNVGSERLYSLTKTTSGANSNSCFGGRCQKAMLGVCLWQWKVEWSRESRHEKGVTCNHVCFETKFHKRVCPKFDPTNELWKKILKCLIHFDRYDSRAVPLLYVDLLTCYLFVYCRHFRQDSFQ